MLAIAGGLGAAILFSVATLCNSRSSRMIGSEQLFAWIMLIGLGITGPTVLLIGIPDGLDPAAVGWMGVAGAGNVVGLLVAYAALRIGKVGVVAPVVSTQGAIAGVIAVIAGEPLSTAAGIALAVIAIGVFVTGVPTDGYPERGDLRAVRYAIGAAFCLGWSVFAIGRVSLDLPVAWSLVPSRLLGVVAVTAPLAVRRGLRITRQTLPLVLVSGVCEVAAFALFAIGARQGIAISAVLASQFAAISSVAAYLLFRERLTHPQIAGAIVIVMGVGALSALQV